MSFAEDFLVGPGLAGTHDSGGHSAAEAAPAAFQWVPIRSLSERQRPRILAHLLALTEPDRYLRFGYAASNDQLAHYTDTIDFSHDEVYGIFNRRLELVATAHLAMLPSQSRSARGEAEFGVSVLPQVRGRGYGRRLFDRAVLHARNRQIDTLLIHTLSQNTAMLRIAHHAGAVIDRQGGEALARLRLPRDDLLSHIDALVEGQAAEIDYRLKQCARRMDGPIEAVDPDVGGLAAARVVTASSRIAASGLDQAGAPGSGIVRPTSAVNMHRITTE